MTTPTPAPAPMTAGKLKSLRETTEGNIRSRALRGLAPGSYATDIALLDHIDALTARVAELERERDTWQAEMDEKISEAEEAAEQHREWPAWAKGILKDLTGLGYQYDAGEDIDLRGDFIDHVNEWMRGIERDWKDRALKAESELAEARKVDDGEVSAALEHLRKVSAVDDRYVGIANLLTRLSAALKEAERRAERAEKMHAEAFRIGIQHQEAAQAAEAKLSGLVDRDLP